MNPGQERSGRGDPLGFSTTASHVIWIIAILGAAGGAMSAYFEVAPMLDEAHEQRARARQERLAERVADASFCWADDTLSVSATNAGGVPIDAVGLTFLVDGIWLGGFSHDINGNAATAIWEPGAPAWFNRSAVLVGPTAVLLTTGRGTSAHVPPAPC